MVALLGSFDAALLVIAAELVQSARNGGFAALFVLAGPAVQVTVAPFLFGNAGGIRAGAAVDVVRLALPVRCKGQRVRD